jgi:NADPH-dependent stearoyl-CoA 9-desaturase
VLAFLSGNLCYQIEHHLFPDLPSNRYAQIAARVRAVCATYDLPYTTGPLACQYLLTLRTIFMLALPDRLLGGTLAERDTHRCDNNLVTGAQRGFTSSSATRRDDTAATSRMAG